MFGTLYTTLILLDDNEVHGARIRDCRILLLLLVGPSPASFPHS